MGMDRIYLFATERTVQDKNKEGSKEGAQGKYTITVAKISVSQKEAGHGNIKPLNDEGIRVHNAAMAALQNFFHLFFPKTISKILKMKVDDQTYYVNAVSYIQWEKKVNAFLMDSGLISAKKEPCEKDSDLQWRFFRAKEGIFQKVNAKDPGNWNVNKEKLPPTLNKGMFFEGK